MAGAAMKMAATSQALSGNQAEPVSFFSDPCTWCQQWFCENPADNCSVISVVAAGVVCIIVAVLDWSWYIIPIVGGVALSVAASRVWALRNLAAEIDRFKAENDRLEVTQARLNGEVDFLGKKKDELTGHVSKLEGTVGDLQGVSEGLQNELEQFHALKGNIEKFAAETGADVKNILGEANKIHAKMERMTNQNERALLGKIAQDLEFLDRDAGMQREEFEDFFARMPHHLQSRFTALGLTFEKVAGDDNVIDFMEIEGMITKLMAETDDKIESIHV